jgi:hypothetical protein
MMRRVTVSCLVLILAAACGKSAEQRQNEEAAKKLEEGAKQVAAATQTAGDDMAKGLQTMAQALQAGANANVQVVDKDRLKAFVPELGGWERGDVKGEQQTMMNIAVSNVETHYTKGEARLDLDITDTSFSQMLIGPLTMFLSLGFEEKTDEGFKRSTKIAGQPAVEEWNTSTKRGEVSALVGGRYIVSATGHGVDSLDVVRKAVEAVDLGKLAAVK